MALDVAQMSNEIALSIQNLISALVGLPIATISSLKTLAAALPGSSKLLSAASSSWANFCPTVLLLASKFTVLLMIAKLRLLPTPLRYVCYFSKYWNFMAIFMLQFKVLCSLQKSKLKNSELGPRTSSLHFSSYKIDTNSVLNLPYCEFQFVYETLHN